jgi:hypothetical protein
MYPEHGAGSEATSYGIGTFGVVAAEIPETTPSSLLKSKKST